MLRIIVVIIFSLIGSIIPASAKKLTGTDHPTLPTQWVSTTIDPPMGEGIEAYNFVPNPTEQFPSTMWSNYTGCQRLIYVTNSMLTTARYLLGCDAVNCCYEEQDGNQVEFQIPNIYYADPRKEVNVTYARTSIVNFGDEIEADEWHWSLDLPNGTPTEKFWAYTENCDTCANGVKLLQWKVQVGVGQKYVIEFKDFIGYDATSQEGVAFAQSFQVPKQCQANNLLKCPDGLHDKYFGSKKTGFKKNKLQV